MSLPGSVADVLTQHVTWEVEGMEVEGIDRMYLNVYVPGLQREQGVAGFFRFHRGQPFASSAFDGSDQQGIRGISRSFSFRKGERKDEIAAEQRKHFQKAEGVVFIGKARRKRRCSAPSAGRNEKTRGTYPWLVRSTAMVNHFYIYCVDHDFGPFFLKFCTYFPYNAKLCLNGHEYAKQQLVKKGVGFEALDNESCAATIRNGYNPSAMD